VKEEKQEQQKVTENNNEDTKMEGTSEQSRRSGREQATPKCNEDYELYVTVEEEDEFMLATFAKMRAPKKKTTRMHWRLLGIIL
jgi:hypothetical protein